MTRTILSAFIVAAALAVPLALRAQPMPAAGPQVTVSIAPAFAERARRILIGERDLDQLRRELTADVVRTSAKHPGQVPVRLDLMLDNAVPNRPTFDQLGRIVSLSYLGSIGLGGAGIGGTATLADGSTQPIRFSWYETELRNEFGPATWTDAERAFDIFARRVAHGDLRPYSLGSASRNGGDFTNQLGY